MTTCTLCGNEEIEKPKTVRESLTCNGQEYARIDVPFGSYCWKNKWLSCQTVVQNLISQRREEFKREHPHYAKFFFKEVKL